MEEEIKDDLVEELIEEETPEEFVDFPVYAKIVGSQFKGYVTTRVGDYQTQFMYSDVIDLGKGTKYDHSTKTIVVDEEYILEQNLSARIKYMDLYRKYQATVNLEYELDTTVVQFIKDLKAKNFEVLEEGCPQLLYFNGEVSEEESGLVKIEQN